MIYWQTFHEFLAMGGYGVFVWSAFGLTALTLLLEILQLQAQNKHIQRLSAQQKESEMEQQATDDRFASRVQSRPDQPTPLPSESKAPL